MDVGSLARTKAAPTYEVQASVVEVGVTSPASVGSLMWAAGMAYRQEYRYKI